LDTVRDAITRGETTIVQDRTKQTPTVQATVLVVMLAVSGWCFAKEASAEKIESEALLQCSRCNNSLCYSVAVIIPN
jgi:hypothetical protein